MITLSEAIDNFLEAKKAINPKTASNYCLTLTTYAGVAGENWADYTGVNAFIAHCRDIGLSKGTLYSYRGNLAIWFNWLILHDFLSDNPMRKAEKIRRPKLVPRAPKVETLIKTLSVFEKYIGVLTPGWELVAVRDLAIYSLLLETGMRVGEVCALTLNDIDLQAGSVAIEDSKTSEGRTVYFDDLTGHDLARWLYYRANIDPRPKTDALFLSKYGGWKAVSTTAVRLQVKKWLLRAGVTHHRCHDLRHAAAILSMINGKPLSDIQMQLGHATIEATARYLKAADVGRKERHLKTSPRANLKGGL
jgi:integrase/recombinase XerD